MNDRALEVFISLLLLGAGLVTLAFRNRRNRMIGFRVGYTWHSDRVWRKVNTFSGLYSIAYSLFLLILAIYGIPLTPFILTMLAFVLSEVVIGTWMAKREYELEELSVEAPEKPPATEGEAMKGTSMGPYLLVQLGLLGFYLILVALFWDKLPERVAVHFSASGRPNGYMDRFSGLIVFPVLGWLLPFSLTFLARDPGFFARMSAGVTQRGWFELNVLTSCALALVFLTVLLYNVGAVSANAINYATVGLLVLIGLGIYRLLRVGKDERA
ncbi:SdpI family protein [Thermococcus prieurii]